LYCFAETGIGPLISSRNVTAIAEQAVALCPQSGRARFFQQIVINPERSIVARSTGKPGFDFPFLRIFNKNKIDLIILE
jgi:hypothetical protein